MNRHLLIVAHGFRTAGLGIGVPSLLLYVWLAVAWIGTPRAPDPSDPPNINIQRDGLVGLLTAGAFALGKVLGLYIQAVEWLFCILTVIAVGLTLIGSSLFLVGRGLFHHALWARIVASLEASCALLASFLILTSLCRGAAIVALIPFGASLYILWVLIRRFSTAP